MLINLDTSVVCRIAIGAIMAVYQIASHPSGWAICFIGVLLSENPCFGSRVIDKGKLGQCADEVSRRYTAFARS